MSTLPNFNHPSPHSSGFTLIELLTVVAIIAIMSGMLIVGLNVPGQIAKANDGRRRNDLTQYKNLIQQYAISHTGKFPYTPPLPNPQWTGGTLSSDGKSMEYLISSSNQNLCSSNNGLGLTNCLYDQKTGSIPTGNPTPMGYYYIVDTTTQTNYVLFARLESSTTKFFEICSSGLAGVKDMTNVAFPNDATCPSPPTGPL